MTIRQNVDFSTRFPLIVNECPPRLIPPSHTPQILALAPTPSSYKHKVLQASSLAR